MSNTAIISIQNLDKTYLDSGQSHEIFKKISLNVQAGEFVVLLGRSGSGKSTLLNLLSGIDCPSCGQICINGFDLTTMTENQRTLFRRHHIGFVFQSYNLIPTLTVAENLLLPLELIKKPHSENRQQAEIILQQLGMENRLDSFPDRLSGGEQQRVAIARALIHQPDLILADEPTGNLDLKTGEQVLQLLDTLVQQSGKTLLMATHSQEVLGRADRVLTIKNKKLIPVET